MEAIEQILEKLKEWAEKLIEALTGGEAEPEMELIPIPLRDSQRYPR
jgi:hypothetical protein